jgi:hypothetical protein
MGRLSAADQFGPSFSRRLLCVRPWYLAERADGQKEKNRGSAMTRDGAGFEVLSNRFGTKLGFFVAIEDFRAHDKCVPGGFYFYCVSKVDTV